MSSEIKPSAGSTVYESTEGAKKEALAAEPKVARASKTRKVARRPQRSSGLRSTGAKLVCRYCGSDDLVPSFKKRGDARCRACFKKRYGSAARDKKAASRQRAAHTGKPKAAK